MFGRCLSSAGKYFTKPLPPPFFPTPHRHPSTPHSAPKIRWRPQPISYRPGSGTLTRHQQLLLLPILLRLRVRLIHRSNMTSRHPKKRSTPSSRCSSRPLYRLRPALGASLNRRGWGRVRACSICGSMRGSSLLKVRLDPSLYFLFLLPILCYTLCSRRRLRRTTPNHRSCD